MSASLLCMVIAKYLSLDQCLSADHVDIRKVASPVAHCLASVRRAIESAVSKTGADEVIIFLSGSKNFRTSIARMKEYKGNRKEFVKPLLYNDITEYLKKRYNAVLTNGIEADDALSIKALELQSAGYTAIIATADKDLMQVPTKIYNVQTHAITDVLSAPFGELTLKMQGSGAVLKGYGMKFFYAQMLTGDTVDNIPGVPRLGANKAFSLLSECETEQDCQLAVEEAYKNAYGEDVKVRVSWDGLEWSGNYKDIMLENGKLLWMLREKPNSSGTHIWKHWW